jgi:hypothetical protein
MTYLNYRGSTDIKKLMAAALKAYKERFGTYPDHLRVHPQWVDEAETLVPNGIAVDRNGGTLVGEIWLPMPEEAEAA